MTMKPVMKLQVTHIQQMQEFETSYPYLDNMDGMHLGLLRREPEAAVERQSDQYVERPAHKIQMFHLECKQMVQRLQHYHIRV